jgi:phage gp36-like protein
MALAVATSVGVIAQQVAGKAIRDALFLSSFAARHLPHAMAAAATVSLLTVVGISMTAARFSPQRLLPSLFGVSGVGFVLEWLLFSASREAATLAVYMHTSVMGPIVITMFWSIVNERFDPHSAKAAVTRIAAGGALGGVLGGIATWRAATSMSVPASVLLLAILHFTCAMTVLAMPPAPQYSGPRLPDGGSNHALTAPSSSAWRLFRESPFLRNLAILVGLGALLSSLLDYAFGVYALQHFGRGPSLLGFFSQFGLVVSVLSLAIQLVLGRMAVEKHAPSGQLVVLPGIVIACGVAGLVAPGIVSATILRGAEMVHRNTLFRSAYELFYTPIPESQKRAAKALSDIGVDRAGMVLGSVLTMAVIYVLPDNQLPIVALAIFFAFVTLPVVRKLHAGYVEALEARLRDGAHKYQTNSFDAAPLSMMNMADSVREGWNSSPDLSRASLVSSLDVGWVGEPDPMVRLGSDLLSNDTETARAALARLDISKRMFAGHAIMLLGNRTLRRDARTALEKLAPDITGQLVDALAARDLDTNIRRMIPLILVVAPTHRAMAGLLDALNDEHFEVRYAAGRSLLRMTETHPELLMPRERVIELILQDAERAEHDHAAVEDEALLDEATARLDALLSHRVTRRWEHLFTLLALLVEREAIRLCFRALHQEDDRYRGTALEYLETVLPPNVREAIWPLLEPEHRPEKKPREPTLILADLTRLLRMGIGGDP